MSWHSIYLFLKIFYKNHFGFLYKNSTKSVEIGEVFKNIYLKNYWGSATTVSGPGSELLSTESLIPKLNTLLDDFRIHSILDIPCGDFNWMKHVDLKGRNYIGADIVSALIESNTQQYKTADIDFKVMDLTSNQLPRVDLILCRDGLVHFNYTEIFRALRQIKQSGSRYLLTTSFNKFPANYNITTGEWRPLNLQKKPFLFPEPIYSIEEFMPSNVPKQYTKLLSLWEINSISIPEKDLM
jgi:hypothetical protein